MEKYVLGTHTLNGRSAVPIPSSSGLGALPSLELFEGVPQSLQLPLLGYYILWAEQKGDLEWEEQPAPLSQGDYKALALYALSDENVRQAEEIAFGDPLPFVAIVTQAPMSATAIEQMWKKTAFAPYETIAIFDDASQEPVPPMLFLHWGQRIDMANAPQHVQPLQSAAEQYNGRLVWAAQVGESPYGGGWREWPTLPFADALAAQLALTPSSIQPGAPPAPPPQVITQTTVQAPSFWSSQNAPILVGFAAFGLAFWWKRKKDRGQ